MTAALTKTSEDLSTTNCEMAGMTIRKLFGMLVDGSPRMSINRKISREPCETYKMGNKIARRITFPTK